MSRPTLPKSEDMEDMEIVAELFQAIRVRQINNVKQVETAFDELFPEVDEERKKRCMLELAMRLCKSNSEVLEPQQRKRLGL